VERERREILEIKGTGTAGEALQGRERERGTWKMRSDKVIEQTAALHAENQMLAQTLVQLTTSIFN
jgi:hypothetical protein